MTSIYERCWYRGALHLGTSGAVTEHDEDVRGRVVAKFPLMKVKEDLFQKFEPMSQRSGAK